MKRRASRGRRHCACVKDAEHRLPDGLGEAGGLAVGDAEAERGNDETGKDDKPGGERQEPQHDRGRPTRQGAVEAISQAGGRASGAGVGIAGGYRLGVRGRRRRWLYAGAVPGG